MRRRQRPSCEGVPTRLSGRSGTKPLAPGGGALLFEGEVPAGGEPGETPVGAVGDDGPHVGQLGQPDVMRPGRVDAHRDRQPADLDADTALGPDRPATPATDSVKRGTRPSAAHGLGSSITIDGSARRRLSARIVRASLPIAAAQTPFARQRRHCAQTTSQGGNRSGRHRHWQPVRRGRASPRPSAGRMAGRRPPPPDRVEQVGDEVPLVIGEVDDRAPRTPTDRHVPASWHGGPIRA